MYVQIIMKPNEDVALMCIKQNKMKWKRKKKIVIITVTIIIVQK